jgi:hypothetical protein
LSGFQFQCFVSQNGEYATAVQYGKAGATFDVVYIKRGEQTRELMPKCQVLTKATFANLENGGRSIR